MSSKAKKKKSSAAGKVKGMLFMIFCLVLSVILQQAFMLILFGMLPSAVAFLIDRTDDRILFRTVFCFNLVGVLPDAVHVYVTDESSAVFMKTKLLNIYLWFKMFTSAALGYLVYWASPGMAQFLLMVMYQNRIRRLRSSQKLLEDEWGERIKEFKVERIG